MQENTRRRAIFPLSCILLAASALIASLGYNGAGRRVDLLAMLPQSFLLQGQGGERLPPQILTPQSQVRLFQPQQQQQREVWLHRVVLRPAVRLVRSAAGIVHRWAGAGLQRLVQENGQVTGEVSVGEEWQRVPGVHAVEGPEQVVRKVQYLEEGEVAIPLSIQGPIVVTSRKVEHFPLRRQWPESRRHHREAKETHKEMIKMQDELKRSDMVGFHTPRPSAPEKMVSV